MEIVFKRKEAYYQESFYEVAFRYGDELIAKESVFYKDQHPIIRIIRAHFSGYHVTATIKDVHGRTLNVGVQFDKDGQIVEGKVQREKSNKTRGTFSVAGFHHLPEDIKTMIWKELKEGDQLQLIGDPTNTYDKEAIKVMFKEKQIGWVSRDYSRKKALFQAAMANKDIKTICVRNKRKSDSIRASRPDADGKWNDKYLGMAQFVEAKFEMEKIK